LLTALAVFICEFLNSIATILAVSAFTFGVFFASLQAVIATEPTFTTFNDCKYSWFAFGVSFTACAADFSVHYFHSPNQRSISSVGGKLP
jgi:hypothetical protein